MEIKGKLHRILGNVLIINYALIMIDELKAEKAEKCLKVLKGKEKFPKVLYAFLSLKKSTKEYVYPLYHNLLY